MRQADGLAVAAQVDGDVGWVPSQESCIEREGLITEDAYSLQFWMPRIEQVVAFDRYDCGRHVQSRSASAREP